MKPKRLGYCATLLCLSSLPALAGDADAEIQYLLSATGQNDCAFIRNGKAHSPTEAEAHLRMKYNIGKNRVDSAEQFIGRIASKSSWTGKSYYIECPNTQKQTAGDWLSDQLALYRRHPAQEQ